MTTRLEQMTRALSLYDAAGDGASSAACLLQGAIDSERGLRPQRCPTTSLSVISRRLIPAR
jgi:hypothetical protein